MNRRDFLASSALAGVAPLAHAGALGAVPPSAAEYYELRRYHMLYGAKQRLLHGFMEEAAFPALSRLGLGPLGAFTVMYGPNSPSLYVLITHKSLESVATTRLRLAEDEAYQQAGADFLAMPMTDPAYVRYESTLMKAFDQMQTLETPLQGESRIFELRTYESHSEAAALRKIEMFNQGGEIPIFRRAGLHPVFFAETVVGQNMPNLTYMLAFENLAARDEAWQQFGQDPAWVKLRSDSYYADTVSAISDLILRPTGYSQI